jgi:phosphatidylserine/phosphatidylglycerophosphate/cardiolipin synthase-like enzyme
LSSMKKLLIAPILFIAALTSGIASIQVYFSPYGGCTQAICQEINQAKSEILIQAYGFTSAPITKAVSDAVKRGVKVTALLDKSNRTAKYSAATFLEHAGARVMIDAQCQGIAHSKVMIIDRSILITGSFNFTKAAEEKNVENVLIIKEEPQVVQKYLEHFNQRCGD